jgi:diaminopropionate ammonia-lyase
MEPSRYVINHPAGPDWDNAAGRAFTEPGVRDFHRSLPGYAPTPLVAAPEPAAELGLGAVYIKDEARRFDVAAFKVLGASWAIQRHLAERPATETFCTATDGNHGMAVAWAAAHFQRRAVVYMPRGTSDARSRRIAQRGAAVHVLDADYDAVVAHAADRAEHEGWTLIQDTARPGYEEVPARIQAGYLTLFEELTEQGLHGSDDPGVELVLLPVGVGSFAAAAVHFYHTRYGKRRPRLLGVEPLRAACLLESLRAGSPRSVATPGTLMAGLNCGTLSSIAWPPLRDGLDGTLALDDGWIPRAVRRCAALREPVVSGETGASGLAALLALSADSTPAPLREHLGLDETARVLLINTEGATDPAAYERLLTDPGTDAEA